MKHSSHILALLVALSVGGMAQAQSTGGTPREKTQGKEAGLSYGPVLDPQAARGAPGTPPPVNDASPQAQEERAGPAAQQPQRQDEVDPSARPAPEPNKPEQTRQPQKKDPKAKPAPRRSVQQRVEGTPRIVAPAAPASGRATDPVRANPPPVLPSTAPVGACQGAACVDTGGTSYNTSSATGTAVRSDGRPCTRSGATMQCL
jgi:outer membrane biosynthesis protein TonB